MVEAERFVGTTVVQLFSFVGIDMVHHQADISLFQMIKAGSLRKDSPDQFMVDFNGAFLIRASCIAIKYPGSQSAIFSAPYSIAFDLRIHCHCL